MAGIVHHTQAFFPMITGRTDIAIISRVAHFTVTTNTSVFVVANTVVIASQGGDGAIGATFLITIVVLIASDALTSALGVTELIGTDTGVGVTGVIGTSILRVVQMISIVLVAGLAVVSGIALLTGANHDTGAVFAIPMIGTGGSQASTVGDA